MIIGFTQAYNELSKGNLNRWIKNLSFCDYIYIWDNNSTDGSKEEYKKHPNLVVIESPVNQFENELLCKRILLTKLLKEHPETDWICWTDVDTLLDNRLVRNDAKVLRYWLDKGKEHGIDAYSLGHINLWRSNYYRRLDSSYDGFNSWGRKPFWRNNGRLEFPPMTGLHQSQEPTGLDNTVRLDYSLIHMGFSTDEQIMERYRLYESKGQRGRDLERLVDETGLWVEEVDGDILPYVLDYVDPSKLERLVDLYEC